MAHKKQECCLTQIHILLDRRMTKLLAFGSISGAVPVITSSVLPLNIEMQLNQSALQNQY